MAHSNNGTISTISKGGYKAEGKVCDVPISFLLDTGAAVTSYGRMHGNESVSPWSGERLVGVDGSPLQVFGKAEVGLMLSGREFRAQSLVVSPLTTQAILGLFQPAGQLTIWFLEILEPHKRAMVHPKGKGSSQ